MSGIGGPVTAAEAFGLRPQVPVMAQVESAPVGVSTSDMGEGLRSLVNPRNPLFWFGVILAATVGAAGVAGSARLGPARVSAGIGST